MRKIAAKCELSLGTIYNYYATKVDLILAIIEDFWNECLKGIDKIYSKEQDFFEQVEFLYFHTLNYLGKFEDNWLKDLNNIYSNDKNKAEQIELRLTDNFKRVIRNLINIHIDDLNINIFENFTEDKISEFIYGQFFIMLKRLEQDYSFFDYALKKILL